jgi:hypothetical protein
MPRKYSRLSKRAESQSKRYLILSILGILVMGFLMLSYGIPFLANFTGFISGFQKSNDSNSNNENSFLIAPTLETLPSATKDSEIEIKGTALKDHEVAIYLNDALVDTNQVEADGTFSFNIFLKPGENRIKARIEKDDNKSEFSDEEIIKYLNKEPLIEIKSPADGQKFEKEQRQIEVSGTTDEGVKVTVNDFWAVMKGTNFSYSLTLKDGDNEIKITATDEAGNKTEKNIKVSYSP